MATTMTLRHGSSLETRPSLLKRLQTGDDSASWQEFYLLYGGLIRTFALKAGLNLDEAEEVVQETAIGVSRGLPNFIYDPEVCRFKTWMLNLARWRVLNQLRKRPRLDATPESAAAARSYPSQKGSEETSGTDPLARMADPMLPEFGAEWDAAWEQNLLQQAMSRVRERIEERQFQIFDMHITKGWPVRDVARIFKISAARIYLTKHRVARMLKQEMRRLEKTAEKALRK